MPARDDEVGTEDPIFKQWYLSVGKCLHFLALAER